MTEEQLPSTKHAELIDLAKRLDRYGAKMSGPGCDEAVRRAARVLSTPGAVMTLTLRVDEEAVCVELVASSARSGRVVVAAHSTIR